MKEMIKRVQNRDALVPIDIVYSPSMIANAIELTALRYTAKLPVKGTYILDAPLVTPENAAQYYSRIRRSKLTSVGLKKPWRSPRGPNARALLECVPCPQRRPKASPSDHQNPTLGSFHLDSMQCCTQRQCAPVNLPTVCPWRPPRVSQSDRQSPWQGSFHPDSTLRYRHPQCIPASWPTVCLRRHRGASPSGHWNPRPGPFRPESRLSSRRRLVMRLLNNSYSFVFAKGRLPGSLDLAEDLLSFSPPDITLGMEIMLGKVLHDRVHQLAARCRSCRAGSPAGSSLGRSVRPGSSRRNRWE